MLIAWLKGLKSWESPLRVRFNSVDWMAFRFIQISVIGCMAKQCRDIRSRHTSKKYRKKEKRKRWSQVVGWSWYAAWICPVRKVQLVYNSIAEFFAIIKILFLLWSQLLKHIDKRDWIYVVSGKQQEAHSTSSSYSTPLYFPNLREFSKVSWRWVLYISWEVQRVRRPWCVVAFNVDVIVFIEFR